MVVLSSTGLPGALLAGILHRPLLYDQGQTRVPEPGRNRGKGVCDTGGNRWSIGVLDEHCVS